MNQVKTLFQQNQLFFLFCFAITFTMLNISTFFGIFTLIGVLLLLVLPIFLKKEDINYTDLIFHYTEMTDNKLRQIAENERLKAQERERLRQEEELKKQAERIVIQAQQKKEREEQRKEQLAHILLQARELMSANGMSEEEIEAALKMKEIEFNQAAEKEEELIQQQQAAETTTPQTPYDAPPVIPKTSSQEKFRLKKKGRVLNYIFLASGFIISFAVFALLTNLGVYNIIVTSVVRYIFFLFLFDVIYFLPALIYHSSTVGKVIFFFLNVFLGVTIIGWLILLLFAVRTNQNYARDEEILHHHRQNNQT